MQKFFSEEWIHNVSVVSNLLENMKPELQTLD